MALATPHAVARAAARGERVRTEIAHALKLARGPTSAKEMRDLIDRDVHVTEIVFQLDRMAGEGRAVEQGKGRYTLAAA